MKSSQKGFTQHLETDIHANINQLRLSAGFIKTIFLTVIGLALLNIFLGIDLVDYLSKERLLEFWSESIAGPLSYLWNKVIVGLVWEFIKGLFS